MSVHGGDCNETWCDFCGCCEHGEADDGIGCRAAGADDGMRCPGDGCGCEGRMGHIPPKRPADAEEPVEPGEVQLHQAESLFELT